MQANTETDYYAVLEINRSATEVEVRRAYRRLAIKWHPDKNPNNPEAEENFKNISRAYEVLSDPKTRATYDEYGISGLREEFGKDDFDVHFHDPFDLFRQFFNNAFSQFGFGGGFGGGFGQPFGHPFGQPHPSGSFFNHSSFNHPFFAQSPFGAPFQDPFFNDPFFASPFGSPFMGLPRGFGQPLHHQGSLLDDAAFNSPQRNRTSSSATWTFGGPGVTQTSTSSYLSNGGTYTKQTIVQNGVKTELTMRDGVVIEKVRTTIVVVLLL